MTARSIVIATPLGPVRLHATERGICRLELPAAAPAGNAGDAPRAPSRGAEAPLLPPYPCLTAAARQLEEYFAGRRRRFDCPLDLRGTAFQLRVWQALTDIPYGTAISYAALARRLGLPGAARAVGQALRANPVPILVPCHRVVAADGTAGGFAAGPDIKLLLLFHEGVALPQRA